MIEDVLTEGEIEAVLGEAMDMQYREPLVYFPAFRKTDIFKISAKGLILIEGNSFTGLTHIRERHGFLSERNDWKDGRVDYPSKMLLSPIEYLAVSDQLYTPNNQRNRTEKYDVYEGYAKTQKMGDTRFRLIMYKDTGIVHTLYPLGDTRYKRKRRVARLRQGTVGMRWNIGTGVKTFYFSYFDINDQERFKVRVHYHFSTFLRIWELEEFDQLGMSKGNSVVKEEPIEVIQDDMRSMAMLGFEEGYVVEEYIEKLLKK